MLALLMLVAPAAALFGFGAKEQPTPEPLPRHLQGVAPAQRELYSGEHFRCSDGRGTVAQALVNDNYCDCEDGSDEPGTPACARGRFYCPNAGFQGKYVPASLVWDGHCDCCDGTDEQAGGLIKCRNTCEADGASWRAAKEESSRRISEGVRARRPMVEAAAEAQRGRAAALAAAQAKAAGARAAREAAEAVAAPLAALDDARHAASVALVSADGGLAVLERGLGTAGLDAAAALEVLIATARDSTSTVWLVDTLQARAAKGELPGVPADFKPAWLCGGGGGEEGEEAAAAAAAPALSTQECAQALGVQALDRGALLLLAHGHAKGAGASAQLMDNLRARGAAASAAWVDDPIHVDRADSEEGKAAARAVEDAKVAESTAAGEVTALESEAGMDFGPQGVFFSLKGKCFELPFQQYTYHVCPFGAARQDSTTLGSYSAWGPGGAGGGLDYTTMLFTAGAHCWNGPARSMRVKFECGPETKLLSVECVRTCALCHSPPFFLFFPHVSPRLHPLPFLPRAVSPKSARMPRACPRPQCARRAWWWQRLPLAALALWTCDEGWRRWARETRTSAIFQTKYTQFESAAAAASTSMAGEKIMMSEETQTRLWLKGGGGGGARRAHALVAFLGGRSWRSRPGGREFLSLLALSWSATFNVHRYCIGQGRWW